MILTHRILEKPNGQMQWLFYIVFISRPDSEAAIEFDDESNAYEESVSLCERKNQQPNGKNIFDLE